MKISVLKGKIRLFSVKNLLLSGFSTLIKTLCNNNFVQNSSALMEFTIAITDDDIDDYEILTYVFSKFNVKHAFKYLQDGSLLLEYLEELIKTKQKLPDLIILDYNMPKINGLQALEIIKKCEHVKHIPVILSSTSDCEEQKKRAFLLGVDGYVTKSASLKNIMEFAENVNAFLRGQKEIPGNQKIK